MGNLQLAWEMLELAKVIYKRYQRVQIWRYCNFNTFCESIDFFFLLRKDTKEEQLMAAQAHLKLGEVSAESGIRL